MSYLLIFIILFTNTHSWSQEAPVLPAPTRASEFLTAESAFLNFDLFKAENIYVHIAKDPQKDDYTFKSLDRLVSIAKMNGDKKLFSEIITTVRTVGDTSNDAYYSLLYSVGKYLFYESNYETSVKFLDKLDENTPYYPKVLYIKAAILGTQKKYKDAILLFDKIIKIKSAYVSQDLKDLAILGKARMFMIMNRYDEALAEYQSVSQWSPYYVDSLKETARVFLAMKNYENAILHLETLAFVSSSLYGDNKNNSLYWSAGDGLTDFDLLNLKTIQGYIYTEQGRFEEASQIFNDIILSYNFIKKNFMEQINRFQVSDDLTQVVSHPNADGTPRSLMINADFVLFNTTDYYSTGLREWLNSKEKGDLLKYLSVYYSLLNRINDIDNSRALPQEAIRVMALRNLMNKYLKAYINILIKRINGRLDDVGLRAQLGKIDITWKTKENQSKKIKEIQEQKQGYIDDLDDKYKRLVE